MSLRLPAAGSAALPERAGYPRASVRPVELDDLHGELPRGEEVRRGAVAGRLLEAEVEDALGEGEGGVGVGVQRESLAVVPAGPLP